MHGRVTARVMVALLAFVLFGGAASFASGAVLPDAKYRDRPGRLPDEKTPLGNPATRGVVQDMAARDQRRRSDQRQQRERPAAREARRRSRLSFAGLSSAAAKDVLSRSFGREVDVSQTGFDRAGRVGRVTRLLDDFTALVDRPTGGNAIAASTLPIRTRDALGRLLPVDLALRPSLGRWQPENPLVPTMLPASLEQGFKLGRTSVGVTVRADRSPDAAAVDESTLLYGNALEDTDIVAAPTELGLELFAQLRSAQSPEELTLSLALPDGATLAQLSSGSIEIRRDGQTLALINPVSAIDADGQPVDASMTADGSTVKIRVPHRNADVAYPVLVDPLITERYDYFNTGDLSTIGDWIFNDAPNGKFVARTNCYELRPYLPDSCYGSGYGPQMYAPPGYYLQSDFMEWYIPAPGYNDQPQRTTYIVGAEFSNVFFRCRGNQNYPFLLTGIYNPAGSWTGLRSYPCDQNYAYLPVYPGDNVSNPATSQGKIAAVAVGFGLSNWYRPSALDAYIGGATFYYDDPESASRAAVTGAESWTDGDGPVSVAATATDPGVGMKYFNLSRLNDDNGWDFLEQRSHPCTAERRSPCPTSWTQSFSIDASDLPEGANRYRTVAYDATQKADATAADFDVKIDRTAPGLRVDGSLAANADDVLVEGAYSLDVSAYDVGAERTAGVESIRVLVDGQEEGTSPAQTDPSDGAPLTRTWQWDTTGVPDGDYTIEVVARDRAGNERTQELYVTVNHIVPLPADSVGLGSGATRIDGVAAGDRTGKSLATIGDVNGDDLVDYAIGAPGADNNGRTDSGSVYVVFGSPDGAPPDLSNLGARGFRIDGAQALDQAGSVVSSAGDVNGDGVDDLVLGAPGISAPLPLQLQGHAYVVFGSASSSGLDLASITTQQRGFRIDGPLVVSISGSAELAFGASASGAKVGAYGAGGDVNGDGLDDMILGSGAESPSLRVAAGNAYVVFGKRDSAPVAAGTPTTGFAIAGASAGDQAGTSVQMAGDVNGDDLADVLVGAPKHNASSSTGATYLIFGRRDAVASVDLAQLGNAGFEVTGAPGDRLGASTAAVGDVNNDGLADFAAGGSRAYMLYGRTQPTRVDLGGQYDGVRVDVPAVGTAGVLVAAASDLNQDGTPDLLVGTRPAAGAGRAYGIYLPRSPAGGSTGATIAVEAMGGHQGVTLNGVSTGDGTGESADGIDALTEDSAGMVIGAPGVDVASGLTARQDAGAAYLVDTGSLAANRAGGAAGTGLQRFAQAASVDTSVCPKFGRGRVWPNRKRGYTPCFEIRTGYDRKPYDRQLDASKMVLPLSRYTKGGAVRDGPVPSTVGAGGRGESTLQDLAINTQDGPQKNRRMWPLKDSLGQPFAWIEQTLTNRKGDRFKIYEADATTLYDTTRAKQDISIRDRKNGPAAIEVQGQGCMVTDAMSRMHALVGLVSGNATRPTESDIAYRQNVGEQGKFVGLRGFIDRNALEDSPFDDSFYRQRDTKCGDTKRSGKLVPVGPQAFQRTTDVYHGITSFKACQDWSAPESVRRVDAERRDCATAYLAYSAPPELAPDVALLTVTTTGVTGRGGAVRMVVRTGTWRRIDEMRYADRNVGCGAPASARWVFYDANPNADASNTAADALRAQAGLPPLPAAERQRHMYGWWPMRDSEGTARFKVLDYLKNETRSCDPSG